MTNFFLYSWCVLQIVMKELILFSFSFFSEICSVPRCQKKSGGSRGGTRRSGEEVSSLWGRRRTRRKVESTMSSKARVWPRRGVLWVSSLDTCLVHVSPSTATAWALSRGILVTAVEDHIRLGPAPVSFILPGVRTGNYKPGSADKETQLLSTQYSDSPCLTLIHYFVWQLASSQRRLRMV